MLFIKMLVIHFLLVILRIFSIIIAYTQPVSGVNLRHPYLYRYHLPILPLFAPCDRPVDDDHKHLHLQRLRQYMIGACSLEGIYISLHRVAGYTWHRIQITINQLKQDETRK